MFRKTTIELKGSQARVMAAREWAKLNYPSLHFKVWSNRGQADSLRVNCTIRSHVEMVNHVALLFKLKTKTL